MHAILAHFGGGHWLLDDKDAKTYAAAVNNVARHYDIRTAQKTLDWFNLLGMIAFIEGTRIVAGKAPKPQPRSGPMGQVFQFNPPAATPPAPAPLPQAEAKPPPAPPGGGNGPQQVLPEGPIEPEGPFH